MSSAGQTWDAGAYARNGRFVADLAANLIDWLAPQAGERILDLGCGDGVLSEKLLEAGAQVIGADASPELVAAAREQIGRAHVCTPVTNAPLVCRLLLENKKH